jgi:hypothetical protein
MQQVADQKRTQHVVTGDAAAVAGVDEVERPALECKARVHQEKPLGYIALYSTI